MLLFLGRVAFFVFLHRGFPQGLVTSLPANVGAGPVPARKPCRERRLPKDFTYIIKDERLARSCPYLKSGKFQSCWITCNDVHAGRCIIPLHLCWDDYTLRRGLLYCYNTIGFPEPQINNDAIRPRILYVGMIIIYSHYY